MQLSFRVTARVICTLDYFISSISIEYITNKIEIHYQHKSAHPTLKDKRLIKVRVSMKLFADKKRWCIFIIYLANYCINTN